MIVAGIDPGMTGAISMFVEGKLTDIHDMPTYDGRVDGLELMALIAGANVVYLENTHPMPKNGSISSYKLGLNTGIVIGVVQAEAIPLVRVSAATWKAYNGLMRKPKDVAIGLARELYPDFKDRLKRVKDHNRAEAVLIGRYGVYRQIQERAS